MRCAEVKQQLDFLIDEEIDSSQKDAIERHLQNCRSCENSLEDLQIVGKTLKKHLPVSASTRLDERVLRAFQNHHSNKNPAATASEKRGFFGRIFVPIPVFALVIAAFAIAVGAAYQLGKMSAANFQLTNLETKNSELPPKKKPPIMQSAQTPSIKYVEVPVTKIIKIPVFRERTITRFVDRNKDDGKNAAPVNSNRTEVAAAADKDNPYFTQLNLKGFQPVSELKPKIIKKEGNQ